MSKLNRSIKIYLIFSLLLTLSIDIALIIIEFYQKNNELKSYLVQLLLNIYIVLGSFLIDYNSFNVSKNIEIQSFKEFGISLYESWKFNQTSNDDKNLSTIKYNYENIVLPYIKNTIEIIQKLFDLLFCVIAIIILLLHNIFFGMICVFILAIIFISIFFLTIRQTYFQNKIIETMSLLQKKILECYFGVRDIVLYKQKSSFISIIHKILKKFMNLFYKSLLISGFDVCMFNSLDVLLPTVLMIIFRNLPVNSINLICITFYFLFAVRKIGNLVSLLQTNIVLYKKYSEVSKNQKIQEEKKHYNKGFKKYKGNMIINNKHIIISNYMSNISNLHIKKFNISYGQKIILSAPIGTGKSVFFRDLFETFGKSKILYIPNDVLLFSGTVYENIFFDNRNILKYEDLKIIKKLGFDEAFLCRTIKYNELSGGEKKRIAFLRFYFNKKEINILDEVISEVEEKNVLGMIEIIKSCNETVILATHNDFLKKHFSSYNLTK